MSIIKKLFFIFGKKSFFCQIHVKMGDSPSFRFHQLGELGAKVVCWDLNESTNLKTREDVEAAGGVAFDFKCDVSDREQVMEAARKTREVSGNFEDKTNCIRFFFRERLFSMKNT